MPESGFKHEEKRAEILSGHLVASLQCALQKALCPPLNLLSTSDVSDDQTEDLSLFMKEILRLQVHFSYRLVVKIFATSTTSVSGTLSIFNLPNRKGICGNTNWGGHGNMFWNHL